MVALDIECHSHTSILIYAGDQRIAMIDSEGKLHFYLNDHLGSARMVIDTAGTVKDSYDYYAFGEALNQTISTGQSYGYTGKPFDNDHSLSLNYYGARYYDGTTGRFISVDPSAARYPTLSPYAYVANSPLSYIDPNGKGILPADPSGLGPQWTLDPTHTPRYGSRWIDPDGNTLEFHKGRPGAPGERGKDHWHLNKNNDKIKTKKKHPHPGDEVPVDIEAPQPEPGAENTPEEPDPGAVQRAMDWVKDHPAETIATTAGAIAVGVALVAIFGPAGLLIGLAGA